MFSNVFVGNVSIGGGFKQTRKKIEIKMLKMITESRIDSFIKAAGEKETFISSFHNSNFSDCPARAPASSYVFMCKYSAVNTRKILLKFAILEKLRESLLSPILCHSLGKGYAIKWRIGTFRRLNGMWSSSIPAGRNPLWKMRSLISNLFGWWW